jgi:hypothetical protein
MKIKSKGHFEGGGAKIVEVGTHPNRILELFA